jgi:L-malate glycosyltransferase
MRRDCAESAVHVLQVVHGMGIGGTERVVMDLARHFNSPGFRTSVCCLDELGDFGRQLRGDGVTVEVLGRRPGVDLGLVRRLQRLCRDLDVHLVHAHQYTPYFYAATACLLRPSLKVIFTEHGRHHPDRLRPRRAVYNQLLRTVTPRYTAVSEFTRESLVAFEKMPRSRIRVIYNGVNTGPAAASMEPLKARRHLGLDVNAGVILSVGRMDRVKDFATLLRAMPRVIREVPGALLLVAGDGDNGYMAELRALAAALGVEARVRFLGGRLDVPDLFAACDVFALTSITEATSMTVLEAMRAGRAVVATDVGGNSELVTHGETGLLVPVGHSGAAADALILLLRSPAQARRMGAAGRRRMADRFDAARAFEAYEQLYHEVLSR